MCVYVYTRFWCNYPTNTLSTLQAQKWHNLKHVKGVCVCVYVYGWLQQNRTSSCRHSKHRMCTVSSTVSVYMCVWFTCMVWMQLCYKDPIDIQSTQVAQSWAQHTDIQREKHHMKHIKHFWSEMHASTHSTAISMLNLCHVSCQVGDAQGALEAYQASISTSSSPAAVINAAKVYFLYVSVCLYVCCLVLRRQTDRQKKHKQDVFELWRASWMVHVRTAVMRNTDDQFAIGFWTPQCMYSCKQSLWRCLEQIILHVLICMQTLRWWTLNPDSLRRSSFVSR
jgi:hypothetical protein